MICINHEVLHVWKVFFCVLCAVKVEPLHTIFILGFFVFYSNHVRKWLLSVKKSWFSDAFGELIFLWVQQVLLYRSVHHQVCCDLSACRRQRSGLINIVVSNCTFRPYGQFANTDD
jgi:hypothetical protein